MRLALTSSDIGYYEVKVASASTFLEQKDKYSPTLFERIMDWLIIKRLIRKLKEANKTLKDDFHLIKQGHNINQKTKVQCKVLHKNVFQFLSRFESLESLEINTKNKSLAELKNEIIQFRNCLKDLELELRLLVYPDRNEAVFTYDELKDLRESFRDLQIEE